MDEVKNLPESVLDDEVLNIMNEANCTAFTNKKVYIPELQGHFINNQVSSVSHQQSLPSSFLQSCSLQTFLETQKLRFLGASLVPTLASSDMILANKSTDQTNITHQ